jgi:hypothetical protein
MTFETWKEKQLRAIDDITAALLLHNNNKLSSLPYPKSYISTKLSNKSCPGDLLRTAPLTKTPQWLPRKIVRSFFCLLVGRVIDNTSAQDKQVRLLAEDAGHFSMIR